MILLAQVTGTPDVEGSSNCVGRVVRSPRCLLWRGGTTELSQSGGNHSQLADVHTRQFTNGRTSLNVSPVCSSCVLVEVFSAWFKVICSELTISSRTCGGTGTN